MPSDTRRRGGPDVLGCGRVRISLLTIEALTIEAPLRPRRYEKQIAKLQKKWKKYQVGPGGHALCGGHMLCGGHAARARCGMAWGSGTHSSVMGPRTACRARGASGSTPTDDESILAHQRPVAR